MKLVGVVRYKEQSTAEVGSMSVLSEANDPVLNFKNEEMQVDYSGST